MNHENKLRPAHDGVTGDQDDSQKYSEDRQNVANNHNDVSGVYNDVVGFQENVNKNQNGQNTTKDSSMLTGMFRDRETSENAFKTLQKKGYSKDDINLVMSDETRNKYFSGEVEKTEIGIKAVNGLAGAGDTKIGIIESLVGSGIPESRAKLYESGIRNGNIVMGVKPRNEEDARFFESNWRSNKAEEIRQ